MTAGCVTVDNVDVEQVCGKHPEGDISSLDATLATRGEERQRTGRGARSAAAAGTFFATAATALPTATASPICTYTICLMI